MLHWTRPQDFSTRLALMAKNGKKTDKHAKDKLLLLLERALMALSYEDITRLAPDHEQFVAQDVAWLEHVEALRRKKQQQAHNAQAAPELGPQLVAVLSETLSALPFQVAPTDAIAVVERTIAQLCVLGKEQLGHALSADDVIPLLVDVVLQTDLPGIHETLFFMTQLAQERFRSSTSFGWSLVSFQSAVEQIKATPA